MIICKILIVVPNTVHSQAGRCQYENRDSLEDERLRLLAGPESL